MGEVHLRSFLTLLAALALAVAAAACGGSANQGTPGSATTKVQMTATPANTTPVPVKDGDVWGPFLFLSDQSKFDATVTVTPAPVNDPNAELIPFQHPGLRRFATVAEMAAFVGTRAQVLAPAFLPAGTELLGAYAIERDPGGPISATGLSYRFAGSTKPFEDPDIWIPASYWYTSPSDIDPLSSTDQLGRVRGVPEMLLVNGRYAVYMPYTNPADVPVSLQVSSTINWYDEDGAYWSVQGRNLGVDTLLRIAESLSPVTPGR